MVKQIAKKQMALVTLVIGLMIGMIIEPLHVEAAGFNLSASTSSVSPNGTFTVSFGSGTTGQYSCSASGGSVVSASTWVEGGSGSAKIKAGSSGSVTVTVTASNVSDSSYNNVTGSKSVTIKIKAPSSSGSTGSGSSNSGSSNSGSSGSGSNNSNSSGSSSNNNTSQPKEEDTRSTDNKLKALSIEGVKLSPAFSSGTTSYTAEVLDVDEITISATKNDSKASVSGTGKKTLDLGNNTFNIVVKAENGATRTYKITVMKDESPTVFMDYDGQRLGVVKNIFELKAFPSFDRCELEHNGEEIYGWYSTPLDMTTVYLQDEKGAKNFYVYKDGVVSSKMHRVKIYDKEYFVFDLNGEEQVRSGFKYEEITVDEETIFGWSFESERLADYKIIQLMDKDGASNEYLYSVKDKNFIVSPGLAPLTEEDYIELVAEMEVQATENADQKAEIGELESTVDHQNESISTWKTLAIVFGVLALVLMVGLIIIALKLKKQMIPIEEDTVTIVDDETMNR